MERTEQPLKGNTMSICTENEFNNIQMASERLHDDAVDALRDVNTNTTTGQLKLLAELRFGATTVLNQIDELSKFLKATQ